MPFRKDYTLPVLTDSQWGYMAGFLDADGCVGVYKGRGVVVFTNTDRTPLELFRGWLGVGGIYLANKGRDASYKGVKDCFNYQIKSANAVVAVLNKLIPLLVIKGGRAQAVVNVLQ